LRRRLGDVLLADVGLLGLFTGVISFLLRRSLEEASLATVETHLRHNLLGLWLLQPGADPPNWTPQAELFQAAALFFYSLAFWKGLHIAYAIPQSRAVVAGGFPNVVILNGWLFVCFQF
jgi:hypothetical protein